MSIIFREPNYVFLANYCKNLSLSFFASIFAPCVISLPESKLFLRSSVASTLWYLIMYSAWIAFFYLAKNQVLDLESEIIKDLDLWLIISVFVLLALTFVFSLVLHLYIKSENRQWFGLKTGLGSLAMSDQDQLVKAYQEVDNKWIEFYMKSNNIELYNYCDDNGQGLFHWICRDGNENFVKMFLDTINETKCCFSCSSNDEQFDIHRKDASGKTAKDLAIENGHENIKAIIEEQDFLEIEETEIPPVVLNHNS